MVPVVLPVVRVPPVPEVVPPDVADPLPDPPVVGREAVLSPEHAAQRVKPSTIGNNAVTEERLFIEILVGKAGRSQAGACERVVDAMRRNTWLRLVFRPVLVS